MNDGIWTVIGLALLPALDNLGGGLSANGCARCRKPLLAARAFIGRFLR